MAPDRDVIIILGKTGYGKSTWLHKYCVGVPRRFCFDPFRKFPAEYLTGEQILERHDSGWFRNTASYSIGTHYLPDLSLIGSIAYLTGHCAFIIEECGFAFAKGERIDDWLAEAIFLGRHQSLTLIFTAQRAVSIPIELRSQASRFVSFRQTERRDVEWCREYLDDVNEEFGIDMLPGLDKLECLDSDGEIVSHYTMKPLGSNDRTGAPGQKADNQTTG